MSTPLSFCDISARFGQEPAPQQSIEEQAGWNPGQLFLDLLQKVQEQKEQSAKQAEEDALMAMVDAMNVSSRDRESGRARETAEEILLKASQTIAEKTGGKVDPTTTLTVQAILACLGDRFTFDQADELQAEREDRAEEEKRAEEVTQQEQTSADPVH